MTRFVLVTGALLALVARPAAACPIDAMQRAATLDAAAAAHRAMTEAGLGCTAEQMNWASQRAGAMHFVAAEQARQAQQPPAQIIALLDRSLGFWPIWQAYALRGDIGQRVAMPDFQRVAIDYQRALVAIQDGGGPEPPTEVIAAVFRKAEQARMLAERPVALQRTRSGQPGALGATQIRSFRPVAVALPIQFTFGTAEFTAGGAQAADELARMLEAEGRPPIRLVGHTDPVGSPEANRVLSVRRAEAVRSFLVRNGYDPGRIEAVGAGQSQPLRIEDPSVYTTAQIHQILRRVEFSRR